MYFRTFLFVLNFYLAMQTGGKNEGLIVVIAKSALAVAESVRR